MSEQKVNPNAWRAALARRLRDVYDQHGPGAFMQTCVQLLDAGVEGSKQGKLSGEVGEVVLAVLLPIYLEQRGIKGSIHHSVYLYDLNNKDSSFRTEVDLVMVTDKVIVCFECKSYKGSIKITGDGVLERSGKKPMDVYAQSLLHHKHIVPYAKRATLNSYRKPSPPVLSAGFLFSKATVQDCRSPNSKQRFLFLTTSTLFQYLDKVFSIYKEPAYDLDGAKELFRKLSASRNLKKQHKEYLGY